MNIIFEQDNNNSSSCSIGEIDSRLFLNYFLKFKTIFEQNSGENNSISRRDLNQNDHEIFI